MAGHTACLEWHLTLVSSVVSASKRRMTSFVGSDPLLRENPASYGVSWSPFEGETPLLTIEATGALRAPADSVQRARRAQACFSASSLPSCLSQEHGVPAAPGRAQDLLPCAEGPRLTGLDRPCTDEQATRSTTPSRQHHRRRRHQRMTPACPLTSLCWGSHVGSVCRRPARG